MNSINEALLASWIRLSTTVVNSRLVSDMPYNESLVCHILYRNYRAGNKENITATDLCEKTHILKSQMNRILKHLEQMNLIKRMRSTIDKRQVFITFNSAQAETFHKQHEKLLALLDTIIDEIGIEKAKTAIEVLSSLSKAANKAIKEI